MHYLRRIAAVVPETIGTGELFRNHFIGALWLSG